MSLLSDPNYVRTRWQTHTLLETDMHCQGECRVRPSGSTIGSALWNRSTVSHRASPFVDMLSVLPSCTRFELSRFPGKRHRVNGLLRFASPHHLLTLVGLVVLYNANVVIDRRCCFLFISSKAKRLIVHDLWLGPSPSREYDQVP